MKTPQIISKKTRIESRYGWFVVTFISTNETMSNWIRKSITEKTYSTEASAIRASEKFLAA